MLQRNYKENNKILLTSYDKLPGILGLVLRLRVRRSRRRIFRFLFLLLVGLLFGTFFFQANFLESLFFEAGGATFRADVKVVAEAARVRHTRADGCVKRLADEGVRHAWCRTAANYTQINKAG